MPGAYRFFRGGVNRENAILFLEALDLLITVLNLVNPPTEVIKNHELKTKAARATQLRNHLDFRLHYQDTQIATPKPKPETKLISFLNDNGALLAALRKWPDSAISTIS